MLCHTHNMGPELSCWLPHCRSQVPETVLTGSTLVTLTCTGCKGAEGCLHYALEGPPASRSHFRMEGPQLQVSRAMGSTQCPASPDLGSPVGQWGPSDRMCCHTESQARVSWAPCSPRPSFTAKL